MNYFSIYIYTHTRVHHHHDHENIYIYREDGSYIILFFVFLSAFMISIRI